MDTVSWHAGLRQCSVMRLLLGSLQTPEQSNVSHSSSNSSTVLWRDALSSSCSAAYWKPATTNTKPVQSAFH
jgi:hypothetical protein